MRKLTFLLACLIMVSVGVVNAQSKSISGKVFSADDGQPIIGASVKVKGTTVGTITGTSGEFKINLQSNAKNLVISYVGMKSIEVEAKNNMVVRLDADTRQIDEVVVTAFGIKRNPRELGVSTAKVSDKELTNGGTTNVMNGLTGKVSGLQINTINNGVNPDTKITLRGNRHFLASNQAAVYGA